MGIDPSNVGRDLFHVPEMGTDGLLKVTGISKKAVEGEVASPKETETLVQDMARRVKTAGSKTAATIQITKEHLQYVKANQNKQAATELLKFVSGVKNRLIQRESAKFGGVIRVALSRLLGNIGKLEKLEKEITSATIVQVPKKIEEALKSTEKVVIPGDLIASERARVRNIVFPEGVPASTGEGPAGTTTLQTPQEESVRTFKEKATFSSDLCTPILTAREIGNEMSQYAALMHPKSEHTNQVELFHLRREIGSSLFKLKVSESNPEKEVIVVVGTIGKNGKMSLRSVAEPIPEKSTPQAFLKDLQKKYGTPFTQELRRTILETSSREPVAKAPAPTALELHDMEEKAVEKTLLTLHGFMGEMQEIASLRKEEGLAAIQKLTAKIEALQGSIVMDIEGPTRRVTGSYKPQMERVFAQLVGMRRELKQLHTSITARPIRREEEVRAQSKVFPEHFGLCVQESEKRVQESIEKSLEMLPKSMVGQNLLEGNDGRFFKLRMDYEHLQHIYVVGARGERRGRGDVAVKFEKDEIEVRGNRFLFRGELLERGALLGKLKERYGVPLDLRLEAEIPYYKLGLKGSEGA